jgi:hypothetical protein
MSLSNKQVAKLELLYKRGERFEDIERRLRISDRTISKYANLHGWKHGESKRDYQIKLTEGEEKRMLNSDLNKADNLRESYLRKINQLENMVNAALGALGSSPDQLRSTSKSEADRVFSILKSLKISSEITNMHYEGSRKALGLDLPRESESPELLPISINVTSKKDNDNSSDGEELLQEEAEVREPEDSSG